MIETADVYKPCEIYASLDQYVIGQDNVKKVLSVAIWNRALRLNNSYNIEEERATVNKSNVLIVGPTGTGKTYVVKTLADIFDFPFASVSATSITKAGYVGKDVEDVIEDLIRSAYNKVESMGLARNDSSQRQWSKDLTQQYAEYGVIYIDEIDKINSKGGGTSLQVSDKDVQDSFLTMLEGEVITFAKPVCGVKEIDTSNILFICGGSFSGISEIIRKRSVKSSIGFTGTVQGPQDVSYNDLLCEIGPDDLVQYGMTPEFVGRLHSICAMSEMTEDVLMDVLQAPEGSLIKDFQNLLGLYGKEITFTKQALKLIAKEALKRKTGARALRSIMETVLLDIQFVLPECEDVNAVKVTTKVVKKALKRGKI